MSTTNRHTPLLLVLLALLISIFAINSISAYIRHVENGAGCQPWPACYGVIGAYLDRDPDRAALAQALTPSNTAKRMHRAIVTVMVVLLGVVVFLVWSQRGRDLSLSPRERRLPIWMVLAVVVLAIVGPASYLKLVPMIALINLCGGFLLLALTWRLLLPLSGTSQLPRSALTSAARTGVWLLALQITLGAWVSGNFAAPACSQLLQCAADASLDLSAFAPWRSLDNDSFGRVVIDHDAALIHLVHRVAAVAVSGYLVWLALRVWSRTPELKAEAMILLVLLVGQWGLGLVALASAIDLNTVLLHHLTASMLILALVRLRYRLQGV
jgi:heme a synthase